MYWNMKEKRKWKDNISDVYDLGRYERVEKTEVVERKKFKPSPIISPVYGILNEDYRPEDIKNKSEVSTNNTLDFNSVRKKAFGEEVKEEPKTTYYEETVTVKLKENDEEKKQKVKTIDELLEDTSDVTIDVEEPKVEEKPDAINEDPEVNDYEKIDEDLEELTPKKDVEKSEYEKVEDDDTLENDLSNDTEFLVWLNFAKEQYLKQTINVSDTERISALEQAIIDIGEVIGNG